jgi:hypothetical protein
MGRPSPLEGQLGEDLVETEPALTADVWADDSRDHFSRLPGDVVDRFLRGAVAEYAPAGAV